MMSGMPRSVVALVLAVVLAVVLAAGYATYALVGPSHSGDGSDRELSAVTEATVTPPTPGSYDPPDLPDAGLASLPSAVNGVRTLYDDLWLVEEGQWWIGNGEIYLPDSSNLVSYRRILESAGTDAAVITAPAADGKYRAKLELHENPPAVPGWCQDVAEASVHMDADPSGLQMGSFDTFSEPVGIPRGWYRVRYCTEKQDVAARQDAFVGDDHATYAGRHLIQLWKAPPQPDQTLRLGSRWATKLES
jgi:hypothetical protein